MREKRLTRSAALEKLITIGRDEDSWDGILTKAFGIDEGGPSWGEESARAHGRVKELHETALKKRVRIAKEMTQIVEKEKELVQEEKVEMRRRKNVGRRVKFLMRHGREEEARALAKQEGIETILAEGQFGPEDDEQGTVATSGPVKDTTAVSKERSIIEEPGKQPSTSKPEQEIIVRKDGKIIPKPDVAQVQADRARRKQAKTFRKTTQLLRKVGHGSKDSKLPAQTPVTPPKVADLRAGLPLRGLRDMSLEQALGEG